MFRMDDFSWGLRLETVQNPNRMDLSKLLDDLRKALPSARPFFGVILDMSGSGPINPELRDLFLHAVRFLSSRGMVRMAACVSSGLVAAQLKRLASEAGIAQGLRCIETSHEGWKLAAEHWAVSGRDLAETPL